MTLPATGDVAVVVGVGGMGRAIARRIGSGRRLLLADLNENTLSAAADGLRDDGHDVTTQVVNVSDRASVRSLAGAADALGRVTHIAHTAGTSQSQASTGTILRVNLLGVALALEEFGRVVAAGGAGLVIASMAAHLLGPLSTEQEHALANTPADELLTLPFLAPEALGPPGVAYAVAKRGNLLRVRAAAALWGDRRARINSISPGIVSTPQGQHELAGPSGDRMRAMIAGSAAKRLGTPEDIAAAAAFLLDPQAGLISGTDLLVDGGIVAARTTVVVSADSQQVNVGTIQNG